MPTAGKDKKPYDFIVVATKNVADVHPTVAELIAPAVTEGHTTIALLQNGLNIEKPIIEAFPKNPVLSGVSLIGATETSHSHVLHDDPGMWKCTRLIYLYIELIRSQTSSS